MTRMSIAIVLAAAIIGGCLMLSGRYDLVNAGITTPDSAPRKLGAWRIDRLTGRVALCQASPVLPSEGGECSTLRHELE
jgi:hypothetical protein